MRGLSHRINSAGNSNGGLSGARYLATAASPYSFAQPPASPRAASEPPLAVQVGPWFLRIRELALRFAPNSSPPRGVHRTLSSLRLLLQRELPALFGDKARPGDSVGHGEAQIGIVIFALGWKRETE